MTVIVSLKMFEIECKFTKWKKIGKYFSFLRIIASENGATDFLY